MTDLSPEVLQTFLGAVTAWRQKKDYKKQVAEERAYAERMAAEARERAKQERIEQGEATAGLMSNLYGGKGQTYIPDTSPTYEDLYRGQHGESTFDRMKREATGMPGFGGPVQFAQPGQTGQPNLPIGGTTPTQIPSISPVPLGPDEQTQANELPPYTPSTQTVPLGRGFIGPTGDELPYVPLTPQQPVTDIMPPGTPKIMPSIGGQYSRYLPTPTPTPPLVPTLEDTFSYRTPYKLEDLPRIIESPEFKNYLEKGGDVGAAIDYFTQFTKDAEAEAQNQTLIRQYKAILKDKPDYKWMMPLVGVNGWFPSDELMQEANKPPKKLTAFEIISKFAGEGNYLDKYGVTDETLQKAEEGDPAAIKQIQEAAEQERDDTNRAKVQAERDDWDYKHPQKLIEEPSPTYGIDIPGYGRIEGLTPSQRLSDIRSEQEKQQNKALPSPKKEENRSAEFDKRAWAEANMSWNDLKWYAGMDPAKSSPFNRPEDQQHYADIYFKIKDEMEVPYGFRNYDEFFSSGGVSPKMPEFPTEAPTQEKVSAQPSLSEDEASAKVQDMIMDVYNHPNDYGFTYEELDSEIRKARANGTTWAEIWAALSTPDTENPNSAPGGGQTSNRGGYDRSRMNTNDIKSIARGQLDKFGWDESEWDALEKLVNAESRWNPKAQNKTSSAYGLFQFLNKTWDSYGFEKTDDPIGQIEAGLTYIKKRYGSPSAAWKFWNEKHKINGKDVGHWY